MNPLHADNPPLFSDSPVDAASSPRAGAAPSAAAPNGGNDESAGSQATKHSPKQLLVEWLAAEESSSWLASALVHATFIILLSLFALNTRGPRSDLWLTGAFESEAMEDLDLELSELREAGEVADLPYEATATLLSPEEIESESLVSAPNLEPATIGDTYQDFGNPLGSFSQPLSTGGGGLEGRGRANRRRLALEGGGSEESEAAVELGLAWLAEHQMDDGGWRFNLRECPQCNGACRNSGVIQSTTASTGLSLLCFLGAGYTHQQGPYQEVVARGLYYLTERMLITSMGGDLRDRSVITDIGNGVPIRYKNGDMYSHAIATLALCEAYAMTRDENLAGPAQQAIDFIVYAQHDAGGWRYEPGEPGDLSVTGWQVTALKSGLLGQREIPRQVWYKVSEFLDSLQEDGGSAYGYQRPEARKASMTAVGLLTRLLLGQWPKDHRPLLKGIARLADEDPRRNHMYFNYYATQAIHHSGAPGWKRWNPRMRDYLVETQATEGHERGSWYFDEAWSDRGGRIYTTTLAILTLEVYYRYMPMYQKAFVENAP